MFFNLDEPLFTFDKTDDFNSQILKAFLLLLIDFALIFILVDRTIYINGRLFFLVIEVSLCVTGLKGVLGVRRQVQIALIEEIVV